MTTSTPTVRVWRGRLIGRVIAAGVVIASFAASVTAADVLFPQPLHIVRRLEDPLAKRTITVHEYCAGDRVVTVNGARTAIADYARQTLTEIDRDEGTYSITRFEEIAASNAALSLKKSEAAWKSTASGAEAWHLARETAGEKVTIELGLDNGTRLSRAALDVLIGAAYPHARRSEHDAIAGAAAGGRGRSVAAMADGSPAIETFALPVEQTVTYEAGGERLTVRNAILEVRSEPAPDDVQRIPPGARLIESRITRAARELRDLDQLPNPPANR